MSRGSLSTDELEKSSNEDANKRPFSLEFFHEVKGMHPDRAVKDSEVEAWACHQRMIPSLKAFKHEDLDTPANNKYLELRLGSDHTKWVKTALSDFGKYARKQVSDAYKYAPYSATQQRARLSILARELAKAGGEVPGSDPFNVAETEEEYRLRMAVALILTVIRDLFTKGSDGYFGKRLGGNKVRKWSAGTVVGDRGARSNGHIDKPAGDADRKGQASRRGTHAGKQKALKRKAASDHDTQDAAEEVAGAQQMPAQPYSVIGTPAGGAHLDIGDANLQVSDTSKRNIKKAKKIQPGSDGFGADLGLAKGVNTTYNPGTVPDVANSSNLFAEGSMQQRDGGTPVEDSGDGAPPFTTPAAEMYQPVNHNQSMPPGGPAQLAAMSLSSIHNRSKAPGGHQEEPSGRVGGLNKGGDGLDQRIGLDDHNRNDDSGTAQEEIEHMDKQLIAQHQLNSALGARVTELIAENSRLELQLEAAKSAQAAAEGKLGELTSGVKVTLEIDVELRAVKETIANLKSRLSDAPNDSIERLVQLLAEAETKKIMLKVKSARAKRVVKAAVTAE